MDFSQATLLGLDLIVLGICDCILINLRYRHKSRSASVYILFWMEQGRYNTVYSEHMSLILKENYKRNPPKVFRYYIITVSKEWASNR